MHYDLTPDALAEHLSVFVRELGVSIIGGCCGTTPEHLAKVVQVCANLEPAQRSPIYEPSAASLYTAAPFEQELSFLVIGERTNANGSKRFREAMLAGDWESDGHDGQGPGARRGSSARRVRRLHRCRRCR